ARGTISQGEPDIRPRRESAAHQAAQSREMPVDVPCLAVVGLVERRAQFAMRADAATQISRLVRGTQHAGDAAAIENLGVPDEKFSHGPHYGPIYWLPPLPRFFGASSWGRSPGMTLATNESTLSGSGRRCSTAICPGTPYPPNTGISLLSLVHRGSTAELYGRRL